MKSGVKAQRSGARHVGLGAIVAAVLLTSACAAGQYAQSAAEQETSDGTSARVGAMTLGGLAIEAPKDGVAWAKGSNVPLDVVIVNGGQRADTLTSVTSPEITGWAVYASPASAAAANAPAATDAPSAPPAGSETSTAKVTVEGHSRVQFGTSEFGSDLHRVLLLNGVKSSLSSGMAIDLTFTFARAGQVDVRVPVRLSASPQTSVIPGPSATGEAG